ncbi:MAG: DNA repair exonuclease [Planctomycetota bacterium]
MFKFLHAADIHLDSPLKGLEHYDEAPVEEIRGATRRALENLVQLAIDEQVAFVLLAGDLYDGDWKDFKTGRFFVAQMARLRDAAIPVYLIAGNHDAANKMTKALRLPENVRMLRHERPETVRLEELDVAIHGQSYANEKITDDLSAGYPAAVPGMFNIGLLHTSATGREGHERYAPCTVEGLRAKEYQYWALGHVHKRELLCEDPPILFPGNLQGRHVRESGPKGCTLVTVDAEHHARIEHQSVDVFRWEVCRVDSSRAATGDDLLDQLRERLEKLVDQADGRPLAVRVEIVGSSRVHETVASEPLRWENEIRAVGQDAGAGSVWIEKVRLRTSPLTVGESTQPIEGPIVELIGLVSKARSDPELLAWLRAQLAPLQEKLPPELREGDGAIGLGETETLRETLDHVEQMLIRRLLAGESES